MQTKVLAALRTAEGLSLALVAAYVAASLFAHSSLRFFVPLGFVVVLVVLAARFGLMVSVLGSLVAAIVFAHRLYLLPGTATAEQTASRMSLGWMILASIVLSYLFFPPQSRPGRSSHDGAREPRN